MRNLDAALVLVIGATACGGSAVGIPVPGAQGGAAGAPDALGPPSAAPGGFVTATPGRTSCSPVPEKVAEVWHGVGALAIQGDDVFLLSDQLHRFSRTAGLVSLPVAARRPNLGAKLVVGGDDVFWTARGVVGDFSTITILRSNRTLQQAPQAIFTKAGITGLEVAGAHVYFGIDDPAGPRIDRLGRDGLDYQPGFSLGATGGMTADDAFIYWSSATGLFRRAIDGSAAQQIAATFGVVVGNDASHVYGFSGRSNGRPEMIVRAPKAGGSIERSAFPDAQDDFTVAFNGDFLYVADSDGSVFRIPKTGGAPQRLGGLGGYDDDDYTPFLAFDDENVYFQAGPPPTTPGQIRTVSDDDPIWLLRMCK